MGGHNVARGGVLYKIAVLIQDNRYYKGIDNQEDGKNSVVLIQTLIKVDHFTIAGLTAVVVELHQINKQYHT